MRPFEARTEPVPNILWKLPNLGNQPPQDVAREDDRRRFRCPQIFVAGARGAGDDFGNLLRAVWDFRWHHSCSDFKVKKEKRKSESVNGRGKRVKGIQGVLETRNPMLKSESAAVPPREEERTSPVMPNHEPPRSTRYEPDDGPCGFCAGLDA